MKRLLFAFLNISALLFSSLSQATIGAVSTATGGSGLAAVEPVDGLLKNPAFIRDLLNRNLAVNYAPDEWAITVSDNAPDSLFPAALQIINTRQTNVNTQKLGLTFAAPRLKTLVVGATAAMVSYEHNPNLNTAEKFHQGVVDVGATLAINRDIGIGFVANRTGSTKVDLAENLQLQKTMAMGLSYTYGNFIRFRFDVESGPNNVTERLVYKAGMENFINDWMVARLGYQNNNVVFKNYGSLGLGFVGPQFGLHYAYISDVAGGTDQKHLIDLAIPF
jgi:hypothetical protein